MEWHKKLAEDDSFEVKVLPAWRPDKAMNLEKADYVDYLKKLSVVSGIGITNYETLLLALHKLNVECWNIHCSTFLQ